jgi:hypothetical protein
MSAGWGSAGARVDPERGDAARNVRRLGECGGHFWAPADEAKPRLRALLAIVLVAGGCATAMGRIENGVFHSVKGYRVTLPPTGWRVDAGQRADLALLGDARAGGMVVDATCGGREVARPLDVLARHLTFGLTRREVLEDGTSTVGGREAAHSVIRGLAAGRTVTVEALVARAEPCVHDFLYVAPSEAFDSGRPAFRALVESFALEPPR